MSHYRLAAPNNRARILIAVFLAVAVHLGFINFEFNQEPVFVPSVSLPRSVSIFLRQSSVVQTPEQPVKKTEDIRSIKKEQLPAEQEPEVPVVQKYPAEIIEAANPLQPYVLFEKTVKKIAVEEIPPVHQKAEVIAEELKPEANEAANVQEPANQVDPKAAQDIEGVRMPGTIQMAYPRYQLNTPPAYPGLARRRRQEGTVILQVKVNEEGRVENLEVDVSSNFPLLDRAALAAVRKWSFEPGRRGEERVKMWVRVPVTFKLKK